MFTSAWWSQRKPEWKKASSFITCSTFMSNNMVSMNFKEPVYLSRTKFLWSQLFFKDYKFHNMHFMNIPLSSLAGYATTWEALGDPYGIVNKFKCCCEGHVKITSTNRKVKSFVNLFLAFPYQIQKMKQKNTKMVNKRQQKNINSSYSRALKAIMLSWTRQFWVKTRQEFRRIFGF